MKAYSLDLRERIVHAVSMGLPPQETARRFEVGVTTVKRFVQRAADADLAPRTSPGRPRVIDGAHAAALEAQLQAHPDATLAEHCAQWEAEHGVRVSLATMYRAITRLGWTRKKRRWQPPSGTKRLVPSGALTWPTCPPTSSSSSMNPAPL